MTTIYDEMPRMTDAEITEWKSNTIEHRLRETLVQIRMIRSTLTDVANAYQTVDTINADSQAHTLTATIERIINGLGEE